MMNCRLIVVLFLATLAAPALAQLGEEPAGGLLPQRAKSNLNDEDRTAIREFVTQHIRTIVANENPAARRAGDELLATYAGTDAFKNAFTEVALEALPPAIRRAELVPATRLLTIANVLDTTETRPMLIEALRDDRVAVRAAAAVGLRRLRPKVAAAGREPWTETLTALRDAGRQEKSRDTLKTIYAALDYSNIQNVPDRATNARLLLDLLENRARLYTGDTEVPAVGADDKGLRVIAKYTNALNADDRNRLLVVIGTMMQHALEEYTGGARKLYEVRTRGANPQLIEQRNAMERLVLIGEDLLTTIMQPDEAPEVTNAMRGLEIAEMKVEWQKWVGLLQNQVQRDFTLAETPDEEPAE